ncbi:hypothetical protein BG006_002268 [Podila minutissima]|uniref:Uncharacterized protein n=1 Tax=Podila minutissima TaxID=64525 RepID=A0A9P5VNG2_9FUNG|nr:hypothetical protein BG006_002268 [Podila minutissima]
MVLSSLPIQFKGASEPWRTLAEAAYNSFQGHDISHIQIPSGGHLQGLRRIYYDKAVSLLSKANLEPMDHYSLFTAMSGIVDLRASHTADMSSYCVQASELLEVDPALSNLLKVLSLHLAQGLKALSVECTRRALEAFDSQQSFLSRADSGSMPPQPSLPVLEQKLWNSDVEQGILPTVMLDMSRGEGGGEEDDDEVGEDRYRVYQPVVELVRYLTSSLEQGEFPKTKDSIANHWKTCLECLSDNRLGLRTGNNSAALDASQARLHGYLGEHELEFVRADDLVMIVDGLEVLIFTVHETESACMRETLYTENLRLNKAVQIAAKAEGVAIRRMYSLNIGGMSAMVCALHEADSGGYLGGAGCDFSICIPETEEEMVSFLNCGAPQLFWNYTKLLLDYQDDVRQTLASVRNKDEP